MKSNFKIILTGLFLTFFSLNVYSQQTFTASNKKIDTSISNLKINEMVPDFEIGTIINYHKTTAKISDFKDRLLILDFWSITCQSCIAALPRMDALQQEFSEEIMVLPVTYDKKENTQAFWKANKYTRNNRLPTVVEDKVLSSYFRHRYISHEVWIYKGKVVAITNPEYVNADNIKKLLRDGTIDLPVKDDFYVFDPKKSPLFLLSSNKVDREKTKMLYSAVSPYKEDITIHMLTTSGIGSVKEGSMIRSYAINQSIWDIYFDYYSKIITYRNLNMPRQSQKNITLWDVADKNKYAWDEKADRLKEDWLRKYGICFETVLPDTGQTQAQINSAAISDLNMLLGLKVGWEKRKEKVLVLVRTTTEDKLRTRNPYPELQIKTVEDMKADLENRKAYTVSEKGTWTRLKDLNDGLSYLVKKMNDQEGNPYVFNGTNYGHGGVDMDLNISSWKDIGAVRKAIAPYGLDLKEEERLVDRFVFTEKNFKE